jgi:hypothetical protein
VNFPWIYIVEPGRTGVQQRGGRALRKYLLNGGFLMFDDFWGEMAWKNVADEMKRVFPDRSFTELGWITRCIAVCFQIKEKGQVLRSFG